MKKLWFTKTLSVKSTELHVYRSGKVKVFIVSACIYWKILLRTFLTIFYGHEMQDYDRLGMKMNENKRELS